MPFLLLAAFATLFAASPPPPPESLFDFDPAFDVRSVETRDASVRLETSRGQGALRIDLGHDTAWPGVTLKAPGGRWDFGAYGLLALEVTNVGAAEATLCCRVDNPGADGRKHCLTGCLRLAPGATETLRIRLTRPLPPGFEDLFFGMRGIPFGLPEGPVLDVANVTQLLLFAPRPEAESSFLVAAVRAEGAPSAGAEDEIPPERFFPMIDVFGQYRHRDWPGKVLRLDDFAARRQEEALDLERHPGPAGWDAYGGWAAGPQRKATGFFRTETYRDRWWLVDPEGRLFWSHGVDCVSPGHATTPVTDRKAWFELPKPGTPLARFFGRSTWAPKGFYEGRAYETYDFSAANLMRKYGDGWRERFADVSHRRLRSWGMNTIGNWSSAEVCRKRRTPYVVAIHAGGPPIEGSRGAWRKFPDVFDPAFEAALGRRMAREKGQSAGDPRCIGYFVDNELGWGRDTSLALATLASPPTQPAKQAFLADLEDTYGAIAHLNTAWGTHHASWDALLDERTPPEAKRARADLVAFGTRIAETYFRLCREAVKAVAPHQLYLGCRFSNVNDVVARAACHACDVVSFNRYENDVSRLRPPEGEDKPLLIGEFHFGALDRGLFHTGLRPVADQVERGQAYEAYVLSALQNPFVVGTHWFQYGDQATTGRGDGENYQIGFIDVCDTPYTETVAACRRVGYALYRRRVGDASQEK